MTKEKQNNIPKAKYPWVWECESRTLIFGELAIAAFLAFLLTSAHAALIQMEVCVVLAKIYAEDAWLIGVIVDLLLGYNNTVLLDVIRKQTPFKNARKNFPGFEISDKDMVDFFS